MSPDGNNPDSSKSSVSNPVSIPPPTQTQKILLDVTPYIDPHATSAIRESVYLLPSTGMIIQGREFSGGYGILSIDNMDGSSDAIVVVTSYGQKKPLMAVYIQKKTRYSIPNIIDGNYDLYIYRGDDWNRSTQKFERNAYFSKFSETFPFITSESEATTWSVTLYKVIDGNANEEILSSENFPQF